MFVLLIHVVLGQRKKCFVECIAGVCVLTIWN